MKILIENEKYPYSIDETSYRAVLCTKQNYIDFVFSIDFWSINDYKKQWHEGIKKLQNKPVSCLITDILNIDKIDEEDWKDENGTTPVIGLLVLYKQNKKIIIQKLLLSGGKYKKYIRKRELPLENIYDYIPQYQKYYPIFYGAQEYEWIVNANTIETNISLEIIDDKPRREFSDSDDNLVVTTKVTINDYVDEIDTPIDDWSIDMYKQQWKKGIERIKSYDSSCIITRIDQRDKYPMMEWWLLYKKDNKIYMYHDYLLEDEFNELGIHHKLTPQNCYASIPSHTKQKEKYRIQEWVADISDVRDLTIETVNPKDMPVKDSLRDMIEKMNS